MKRRKRDADRNPLWWCHDNPLLDTRKYEVEFLDGATDTFRADIVIAESMYSQVDEEDGNSYSLISEIVDHTSDGTAVRTDGGFEVTTDGRQRH